MKLRVAYHRYTSCGGCQLTFLNCERELAAVENLFAIVEFPLISSADDAGSSLDVALIEGSITTVEELQQLLDLRRRTKYLIAVGACALSGGINALAQEQEIELREGDRLNVFSPQPLSSFAKIDGEIVGCPPEGSDYLRLLGVLQQGGFPTENVVPVCMECRLRENRCLLIEGQQPCLGPVTRSGCLARCPSYGVICEGCRGAIPEANDPELTQLLLQAGLTAEEIRGRMERFSGRGDESY